MSQVIAITLSRYSPDSGFYRPNLLFFEQAPGENFDEFMVRIFRTIQTHQTYRNLAWRDPEDLLYADDTLFVSVNCTVNDHYPHEIRKALLSFLKEEEMRIFQGMID